ncbi:PepSY domain-containing protein [Flavivirga eckloniae]|uniref:NADPH--hemoprotein reductase n=1 Tax=Flavivirga eckloniae TaxID=1803846 RepID=A0A2K9PX80_9FLAO|nr:PepSY domain-containing protein [Flavivirga eckloniae]AUP81685.1 FAD-binding oxidoreductase [Flavivirga eckloniae]
MTISIWRYSHLTLAILSSVFILLATLTGLILAFEPISNQLKPYAIKDADGLSLFTTIENLKSEYDEIISIEIDENDFIAASVLTKAGKNETFYIDPFTAKKIGDIIEKTPLFKFTTNLHRSLFLKSIGRVIIGIVSFLLFLIALTGTILISKRQGGYKRFFSKIVKEGFNQYYHVALGRYALIPIIIVTLTGVYLSLEKFSLLPSNKVSHTIKEASSIENPKQLRADFTLFKSLTLKEISRVDFPFSDDAEDYFFIKLKDSEIFVNQYSGEIVSEQGYGITAQASSWSLLLHTGQGNTFWAIMLLLTCIAILFFMYSGFTMALNRKNKSVTIQNKYTKDNAEFVILVGSETGSTFNFANTLYQALIALGKYPFISELNSYSTYKKAKHLIVLTATYGDGEAPTNAKNFENLIGEIRQQNTLQYSVVGFGSLAYKGFCKYAIIVDAMLQLHKQFVPNLSLHKINNQSFDAFKDWAKSWGVSKGLALNIEEPQKKLTHKKLKQFKVVNRSVINTDDTFLLELAPEQKLKFTSGDLLSIYPNNDSVERLYSIGKINGNILLGVKKHEFGLCSTYFSQLKKNDSILADIKQNKGFQFPASAKEVIMIANGTGIGPFLGMLNDKNFEKAKKYLFWGARTQASFQMYSSLVDEAFYNNKLSGLYLSFSKEKNQKKYVQNAITERYDLVCRVLKNDGVIMICGSIAMQKDVLKTLDRITLGKLKSPLNDFEKRGQLKMDCY